MSTLENEDTRRLFERTRYRLLKQAVEVLAARCDGALMRDDQGFDGADTRAGHLYAFLPLDAWPLSAFHRVWIWTKKYRRQLEAMGIDTSQLPEPPLFQREDRALSLRTDGRGYFVVFPNDEWELNEEFRSLAGSTLHRVPIGENAKLAFRYRTFHGVASALLTFAEHHHFWLGPGVRESAQEQEVSAALSSGNRVVYEQASDSFALYFPDRRLNAEVKAIPRRTFSNTGGFHWVIAAHSSSVGPLRTFLTRHAFSLAPDAKQRLRELEREVSSRV